MVQSGRRKPWRAVPDRTCTCVSAALLIAAVAACTSCGREDAPPGPTKPEPTALTATPQPALKKRPTYTIPRELLNEHAEVGRFVIQFLETCYAGDYQGYRNLVGRAFNPESEERFRTIYEAIESIVLDSIEVVDVSDIPPPAYLVISSVTFDPEHTVSLRRPHRRLAILVFREEGEWRMGPAPPRFQPAEDLEPQDPARSAPAEPEPYYPWNADGDA